MRPAALLLAIIAITSVLSLNYSAGVTRLEEDHAPGWSRQVAAGETDCALPPAVALRPDGSIQLAWSEFGAVVTAAVTPEGRVVPGARISLDDPGPPCFAGPWLATTAATPAGRRLVLVDPAGGRADVTAVAAEAVVALGAAGDERLVVFTGSSLELRRLPEGELLDGAVLPVGSGLRFSACADGSGAVHVAYAEPQVRSFDLGYWRVPASGGPGTRLSLGAANPFRQSFHGPAIALTGEAVTVLYSLQALVGVEAKVHAVTADGGHDILPAVAGPLSAFSTFLSEPCAVSGLTACIGEVTWTTRVQEYEVGFLLEDGQRTFVPVSRAKGACLSPRLSTHGGEFAMAWLETAGSGMYGVRVASTAAGLRAATSGSLDGDKGKALGDVAAHAAAALSALPLSIIWLVPGYMAALIMVFLIQDRVDRHALTYAAGPALLQAVVMVVSVQGRFYTPVLRTLAPPHLLWPWAELVIPVSVCMVAAVVTWLASRGARWGMLKAYSLFAVFSSFLLFLVYGPTLMS